jgi:hypothetical protein
MLQSLMHYRVDLFRIIIDKNIRGTGDSTFEKILFCGDRELRVTG